MNTQFELYTEFVDEKPIKYQTLSTNYLDVLNDPAIMSFSPPVITGKSLNIQCDLKSTIEIFVK